MSDMNRTPEEAAAYQFKVLREALEDIRGQAHALGHDQFTPRISQDTQRRFREIEAIAHNALAFKPR